jgi:hypothetical protein
VGWKSASAEGLELCERHAGLDTRKSVADSEAHKRTNDDKLCLSVDFFKIMLRSLTKIAVIMLVRWINA